MIKQEDTLKGKQDKVETNCLAVKERHVVIRLQSLPACRLDSMRIKIKTLER